MLDFETRAAVGHFNTSPMEAGDRANEAEAEPIAGSAAASLKPVEPLENMLTFIGGNSRPVIGDRNDGATLAFFDFHGHSTRVTAMFNGVIDEIGHRVEQEVPVARSEHAPIPRNLEMPALIFRRGIEKLHDLARDFHEVYRMKRGRSIIRLYLRDPRERGEHAKDTVEALDRHRRRVVDCRPSPAVRAYGPKVCVSRALHCR